MDADREYTVQYRRPPAHSDRHYAEQIGHWENLNCISLPPHVLFPLLLLKTHWMRKPGVSPLWPSPPMGFEKLVRRMRGGGCEEYGIEILPRKMQMRFSCALSLIIYWRYWIAVSHTTRWGRQHAHSSPHRQNKGLWLKLTVPGCSALRGQTVVKCSILAWREEFVFKMHCERRLRYILSFIPFLCCFVQCAFEEKVQAHQRGSMHLHG